jgi:predicted Zn finger-like uncharacterized protein
MVIACDACSARYLVKDDWIRGGRWKFRCKKCETVVRVDGRKVAALPRTLPPPPGAPPRASSVPPPPRTSPSARPAPFDGWFGMTRMRLPTGTGVLPPPTPPPFRANAARRSTPAGPEPKLVRAPTPAAAKPDAASGADIDVTIDFES